ncbi:MAG: hypothetical protein IKN05_07930, partial [Clostridia bacterium]|nr:hypothetical protein [Clostridia bacterium]
NDGGRPLWEGHRERLQRVEKLIESGAAAAPARAPSKPAPKAPEAQKPQAAPKPQPTPAETPPQPWLDAIARLQEENPSIRSPLGSMRFLRYDGRQATVEFSKKNMMHMKLLERKKPLIEAALAEAFGQPVSIAMNLEGSDAAEKDISRTAQEVINQAYDVFGRDKISLEE